MINPINTIKDMKNIYILIAVFATAILSVSCNDEWAEEQYEHYIGFRSPLNDQGVTEIYVPYSRKNIEGEYVAGGEGRSNYELPVIVSGSLTNQQNITVHVAHDADTLNTLNASRFMSRTDLYYEDMMGKDYKYVTFPETMEVKAGNDVGLLNINFDFKNIDMSEKWVLPLTVVDDPSYNYQANPRKNYAKAILRIYPFNAYSGVYSGTLLNNYLASDNTDPEKAEEEEQKNGSITKNSIKGYVVDENTIFFYAGNIDEDRTDRKKYKIFAKFEEGVSGMVTLSCDTDENGMNFELYPNKQASFRIVEEMDATRPYLKHRYVIINNIDYYYSDYTAVAGTSVRYHVKGTLTLSRKINTQIPDEDQAIEW